ncbi:unnamed protein product [Phaedon cochleariae]|uniref:Elongation of very long chain fatty acids protein n=1 Tax=Phaedon cochleariae TaxID=80249 RepID=A0A9P0DB63_PHACE|nr:unnamed protein product [Phaedon cochleariae]
MSLLGNMMRKVDSYFEEDEDPILAKWPMMSNPLNTILISLFHMYFVKVLGPAIMMNRKPFQLQRTLLVYNFCQVIFSSWIFYGFASSGWLTGEYSFRCQPKDTSNSPHSITMARATYWYYVSKLTDLLDTVFFVLRKKSKQISLLHILHHGLMPIGCWVVAKYSPSGQVTFVGLLNSFVHIVMYSYYWLSALGPEVRKYLWWKKYLTGLQITQFIIIIIHTSQPLFLDCDFSKIISAWIALETCLFLVLFGNFYRDAYKRKHSSSEVMNTTAETSNKVTEKLD